MEIKLTEEQYEQVRQDRVLDISAPMFTLNILRIWMPITLKYITKSDRHLAAEIMCFTSMTLKN